jgi:DNA-binding XRE family transcriptional regulator
LDSHEIVTSQRHEAITAPEPTGVDAVTEPSPEQVGGIIKRYREEDLQLPQADLAWLASVSRGTISNVETGRVRPDERTWHRIQTALGWKRASLEDIERGSRLESLMPTDAVQGIVQAILAIREQDGDMGARVAARWRRLNSGLMRAGAVPRTEIRSELAWLANEISLKAAPERLPAIHAALQAFGWTVNDYAPSQEDSAAATPREVRRAIAPLTEAVNHMSVQVRNFRQQVRGFERLPVRVQELLTHGLVVDSETYRPTDTPGVTVVDLVILDEHASALFPRRRLLDATRRWGSILLVAKHIFEELAPDREPQEIIQAVERSLATPIVPGEPSDTGTPCYPALEAAVTRLGQLLLDSRPEIEAKPEEAEQAGAAP